MRKVRRVPRCSCSFECTVRFSDGFCINSYLVDISSNGGAIVPSDVTNMSRFNDGDEGEIVIDLISGMEIKSKLTAKVAVSWHKGTIVGLEIVEIDNANFKKWLILMYKSYFVV